MKEKLKRTKQCAHCPWKVETDLNDIPNYKPDMHRNLKKTISDGSIGEAFNDLSAMACHESTDEDMTYCVGWLKNQLGRGNNIGLRMQMCNYSNAKEIETFGKQYECFEDTLPENRY